MFQHIQRLQLVTNENQTEDENNQNADESDDYRVIFQRLVGTEDVTFWTYDASTPMLVVERSGESLMTSRTSVW